MFMELKLQSIEKFIFFLSFYFVKILNLKPIQEWIDKHLIKIINQSDYYGNQYILMQMMKSLKLKTIY